MTQQNFDLLMNMVFGPNATIDDRFTWEEVTPDNVDTMSDAIKERTKHITVVHEADDVRRWQDFRLYRITGCAHKHREGGVCDTCGNDETLTA